MRLTHTYALEDQIAITVQLETSLKHQFAEATRLQDKCTQLQAASEQIRADSRPCTVSHLRWCR